MVPLAQWVLLARQVQRAQQALLGLPVPLALPDRPEPLVRQAPMDRWVLPVPPALPELREPTERWVLPVLRGTLDRLGQLVPRESRERPELPGLRVLPGLLELREPTELPAPPALLGKPPQSEWEA